MEAATVRKRTEPRIGSAPLKITSAVVGQTPWSARDPLVPLFELSSDSHQADEGVGLQTRGSAPHRIFILIDGQAGPWSTPSQSRLGWVWDPFQDHFTTAEAYADGSVTRA